MTLSSPLSPDGLKEMLKQDEAQADAALTVEPFDYGFPLRPYQRDAIRAVEETLAGGVQRRMLLAMATGTGKTKTCTALIYRFLKTQRFRRVLFLVDRSALGEQEMGIGRDLMRRSLSALADAAPIEGIIWDYRALRIAHEARKGIWDAGNQASHLT
jgi:type I restriction enzyme R subunit